MKTYICGHRNPDTDSIASAYALADLRRRGGMENVEAICAGRLPPKAKWVFNHFGIDPVKSKRDVYVRVKDLIAPDVPMVDSSSRLVDALRELEQSGESSLPVRNGQGKFVGMLSPAKLLSLFIDKADLTIDVASAPLHACSQILSDTDKVHDIRSLCVRNPHNHFPVVDENGILIGTVLKSAFAELPPVQMILVDHNEIEQGIPGLEELPVVEVVDHHRIAFAPTKEPIRYTADIVGSTCTLVARMFRAAGERPTKETAGVLIAGIVADTLLFQSPTTTEVDKTMCSWLEKICGESAQYIMSEMLAVDSPLSSMDPKDALASDAKFYSESGKRFMLAQLEETKSALFHGYIGELTKAMEEAISKDKLDFVALMVTDPVRGDSELLFKGDAAVLRALPYRRGPHGTLLMPGVLSRKKQLLPEILSAIG
ncbi:MAG: DHH family phosphoesterase [Kiritimatiellae bacterium]|nr:DHH family phosphoesterase [Kiritimatiellia bacterium]